MTTPTTGALCAVAALTLSPVLPAASVRAPARAALLGVVERTFAGDYDAAEDALRRMTMETPAHPAPDFYHASVLFWRINPDLSRADLDGRIVHHLQQCIGKALPLLDDAAARVEGLHYLGLCHTYLGRLEAQRGNLYAGGTQGEKGRDYLERALALCRDPTLRDSHCEDVQFPLGAYAYYAGRLPRFMQWLNFLWFVPRGTTAEGLAALERARRSSELHRLGATSLLANIYALFEPGQQARALALSTELVQRFADNPYLDVEHAHALLGAGQAAAARTHAAGVVGKWRRGLRAYDDATALNAQLVDAEASLILGQLEAAERTLRALRAEPRFGRLTGTPRIALLQGMLADLRGERARAVLLYEEVVAHEGRTWNRQAAKAAQGYLEAPYRGPQAPAP